MATARFDTVWINGSVGAGKTATADHLGEELHRRGVPGAVIDVDRLRRCWPAPPEDPFCDEVARANVRAVARNYRDRGAQIVVVAGVAETPDGLAQNVRAAGAERALHVRLTVDRDVALSRLRSRHGHDDPDLEWHIRRHPVLAQVLDQAGFRDELLIDTTSHTVRDVARRIADHMVAEA